MDQPVPSPSLDLRPDFYLLPIERLAWFRGQRFWLLFLLVLLILGVLLALQVQTSSMLRALFADISPAVALFSAFSGALWVSLRLPKGQARLAWRYITLAFLSYFIAEVIEAGVVLLTGSNPTPPSLGDLFILAFYPLLITGLLLLPSSAINRSTRGRLLIDAGILACAVLGLSLLTIIAPLLASTGDTGLLEKVLVVAYPLGDVALIATLVLLLLRETESALRPLLLWMIVGIVLFVYADTAFNILTLQDLYVISSPFVDPFTTAGEFCMGLSAWFYLVHGSEPGSDWTWLTAVRKTTIRLPWLQWTQKYLFPYVPFLLIMLFVIIRELLPAREVSITPLLEGLALVVVFLTITRQILLSNDLVDARVANERTQQLDALKDQFITSINHELRTPLMTMQTYIELLRYQQQKLPDRTGKLVEAIGQTNDALVDLVQSILEVRRIDQRNETFPHEVVNLKHTLDQVLTLINPREGRIAERVLHIDLPEDLAIWGETVRMQQVLTNLVSNAIKYSPAEASIDISAHVVQIESAKRSAKAGKQRTMVEILVRDHGLGIPPEQIPLLFHRFVRLPRDLASNVVGSGLGLYLCQNLVEAMGGRIWVESQGIAGEGSTFFIHLPIAETPSSERQPGGRLEMQFG